MVRQALYIACPIPSRMIGGPAGEDVVSVVQPISSTLTAGTKPSGLHLPSSKWASGCFARENSPLITSQKSQVPIFVYFRFAI